MKQGLRMRCRRITSGFLAFTMTAILVLGDAGAALASTDGSRFFKDETEMSGEGYSQATSSNATFKNHEEKDIVMSVFSSNDSDFRAGGMVFLDVHVKNETNTVITDGVLDFAGRKLKESGAYFEEPEDDVVSDGDFDMSDEEEDDEALIDYSQDMELVDDRADAELDDAEFQGERSEKEAEDEDENEDKLLQKIEGIRLAPGQIYTARFVYCIDESIEKASNKSIRFRFKGKAEDRNVSQSEEFEYAVNHLNLDEIKFENGNEVETGEIVTMGIHTSMFDFDTFLSNSKVEEELEKLEEEKKKASASNAEEAGQPDEPTATSSDAEPASPSNAEEAGQPDEEGTVSGRQEDADVQKPSSDGDASENGQETASGEQSSTADGQETASGEQEGATDVDDASLNKEAGEESSLKEQETTAGGQESVGEERSETKPAGQEEAESEERAEESIEASVSREETEAGANGEADADDASEESAGDVSGRETAEDAFGEESAEDVSDDKAEENENVFFEGASEDENGEDTADTEEASGSQEETAENEAASNILKVPVSGEEAADTNAGSTAETKEKDEDEEAFEDDKDNDNFVVDLGDVVYEIQMTNAKLNGFEVRDALVSDAYENMMVCSFRVSRNVKPGIYFGKVIQKTKAKHRTYRSSQGFALIVSGEGDVTLETKVEGSDAVVTVSGPATSFPEADQLEVSAREISMDEITDSQQKEMIQAAMAKKAQEEGLDIKAFKAMDVKLYADGEEVHQMEDDIQVIFQNVKAEDTLETAEADGREIAAENTSARVMLRSAGVRMRSNVQGVSLDGMEPAEDYEWSEDDAGESSGDEAWPEDDAGEPADDGAWSDESGFEESQEDEAEWTYDDESSEDWMAGDDDWTDEYGLDEESTGADQTGENGAETAQTEGEAWLSKLYSELGIEPGAEAETDTSAKETQAVQIWHLDEESQEISEMDVVMDGDDTAVMQTNHFSIYIWVDLSPKLTGNITVTIQHYGRGIKAVNGTAKASDETDTVFQKSSKTVRQKSNYNPQLYSTDKLTLPNQTYIDINKLSKVLNAGTGHYTVDTVDITESGGTKKTYYYSGGKYYTNASHTKEVTNLTFKKNTTIRFWYEPRTASETKAVTFYDYNITNGKRYNASKKETSSGMYLYTNERKMNHNDRFDNSNDSAAADKKKIGIGQPAAGNMSSWADTAAYGGNGKYLNKGNTGAKGTGGAGVVKNIVTGLKDGQLVFNKSNVNMNTKLFAASGTNSKKFNGDLVFSRNGDTYTLSKAKVDGYGETVTGLTSIKGYADNKVYSNNFWPLDKVKYEGKDPNMGATGKTFYCLDGAQGTIGASDDGKAHNWFFGMKYSFTFKVGDYVGPMEYYFRGDDDFWLFIDGKKAIDIGGIHIALGETLDVRQWLIDNKKLNKDNPTDAQKNATHTVDIYYMERGGFGSCCYMQFTLPNSKEVTVPSVPTTSYAVVKKWDDNNNPYRPASILVELYQNNKATGERKTLNAANGWKATWSGLPAKNGKENKAFTYTAKEINSSGNITVPPGYTSSGVSSGSATSGTITNTLQKTKVKVTKKWEDENNKYNRRQAVKFRLMSSTNGSTFADYKDLSGNYKEVTLNAANNWTADFTDLPTKDKSNKTISYKVKELTTIPGYTMGTPVKKTPIPSGYESSWEATNTYASSKLTVEKVWEGPVPDSQKFDVKVALYEMNSNGAPKQQVGGIVTLNKENGWKYTWTGLTALDTANNPITYRPYEVDANGKRMEAGTIIPVTTGQFRVSYSGNRITNTYKPETVKVKVRKNWANDKEDDRPDMIEIQLCYADGNDYIDSDGNEKILILTANDGWTGEFTDLPKYKDNGDLLHYTIKELSQIDGYTSQEAQKVTLSADEAKSYESSWEITNRFREELIDIPVEKQWDELVSDADKTEVKVRLYQVTEDQDGKRELIPVAGQSELTLSSASGWSGVWNGLPRYTADGQEIEYLPYEMNGDVPAEHGAVVLDGKFVVSYDENHNQILNMYNLRSLAVVKEWIDENNAHHSRPDELKVRLLRDGEMQEEVVIKPDSDGVWKHVWENIPRKNANGVDYVYKVEELDENGTPARQKQIASFNGGYSYEASYDMNTVGADGSEEFPFRISNVIKPAYVRLRKEIVGEDEEDTFTSDYKFLIHLRDVETGEIYTEVALGHKEISGSVRLVLPARGKQFKVVEIVPMEYEIDGYEMKRVKDGKDDTGSGPNEGEGDGSIEGGNDDIDNEGDEDNDGEIIIRDPYEVPGDVTYPSDSTITVKPGDDIIFTVKNRPEHNGYFHHTTAVTNAYDAEAGEFEQRNAYSEVPDKEKSDGPVQEPTSQVLAGLWPDRIEEDDDDDVRLV